MLRKLSLAAVAAVSLGAAALAPTSASAWGWMAGTAAGTRRLGLGPALLVGGPAYYRLRLWRLLCAATGPDPLGTALAPGQPLLLIEPRFRRARRPRPRAGAFCYCGEPAVFHAIFTKEAMQSRPDGNQFRRRDLVPHQSPWRRAAEPAMNGQIDRQQRSDRPQDQPIDLRCRRRTAAAEPAARALGPSPTSSICLDELRQRGTARAAPSRQTSSR